MKLLLRITVLALAALGARTLFERIRPRVSGATGTGNVIGETLTPAFREAASSVKNASTHAVNEVAGATRQAAEELKDAAISPTPTPSPTTTPAGGSVDPAPTRGGVTPSPATEQDHPLSAMAARDLGLEDGDRP